MFFKGSYDGSGCMSYELFKADWDSEWAPYRDLVAWLFTLTVANGPGLFWLYIFLDALRAAESRAYWFSPTPTGEISVFAQYVGAIVLFLLWAGIVLAMFHRPFRQTVREVRR
jgi:hypothetical protein